MIVDNFTLIISITLIILAIITSLAANPFFRLHEEEGKRHDDDTNDNDESEGNNRTANLPCLSVVVVSNGTAEQMDSQLSAILAQDYTPGFEVIVVAVQRDSQTEDVLKRYATKTDKLYTTFVPQRSLFMSRAKLAVTIGVKAAHHEWVLVTDSRYMPQSDQWLKHMAMGCEDDKDIVLGYTN